MRKTAAVASESFPRELWTRGTMLKVSIKPECTAKHFGLASFGLLSSNSCCWKQKVNKLSLQLLN